MKRTITGLLLCFIFSIAFIWAEDDTVNNVRLDNINSINFPNLRVYVSVEDKEGVPNQSLVKGNFTAKIDTEDPVSSLVVEPFKYLEEPVHYIFFLSVSGLMDGKPIVTQKKALLEFSAQIREIDTLSAFLVGENQKEVFSYKTVIDIPEDLIQEIGIDESQAKIFDTLVRGVRKVEKDKLEDTVKKDERVVFILISDGRDNESRYTLEQTGQILSDSGIPLYTIGLKVLNEASLSMLNELSNKSGGYYYYTPNPDGIANNLSLFIDQISMSYVLSFKVKGVKADDSFHQLMIQIDDKETSSQAFRNFLAIKNPFPLWLKITAAACILFLILLMIFLMILRKIKLRKRLGISKRKCPDCKRRMKDDWEFCPFCRYLPPKKKKGKNKEGEIA